MKLLRFKSELERLRKSKYCSFRIACHINEIERRLDRINKELKQLKQ